MFNPGGFQGRLHACPFLGTWRALLCGEVVRVGAASDDLQRFLEDRRFGIQKPSGVVRAKYLRRTYSGQSLTLQSYRLALNMPCQDKGMPSRAARGYRKLGAIGCRGASWSEQLDSKELREALGSAIGAERIPVFWALSTWPAHPSYYSVVC